MSMSKRDVKRLVWIAMSVGLYFLAPHVGDGAVEELRLMAAVVFGWSMPSSAIVGKQP